MATLLELIAEHHITATTKKLAAFTHTAWTPQQPAQVRQQWRVTLMRAPDRGPRHQLVTLEDTPYGAEAPTVARVLGGLILDALAVQEPTTYEAWAEEYGYDPDRQKTRGIWTESLRAARHLRRFLGEHFEAFMACTNPDQQQQS